MLLKRTLKLINNFLWDLQLFCFSFIFLWWKWLASDSSIQARTLPAFVPVWLYTTPVPLRREKNQQYSCCSASETGPWGKKLWCSSHILPGLLPSIESESISICLTSYMLQKHNKRNKLKCFQEFWRGNQPSCWHTMVWETLSTKWNPLKSLTH